MNDDRRDGEAGDDGLTETATDGPSSSESAGDRSGGLPVTKRQVLGTLAGTGLLATMAAGDGAFDAGGGTVLGIGGGSMADAAQEFRVKYYVGTMAERPSAGVRDRVWEVNDPSDPANHGKVFYDDGSSWSLADRQLASLSTEASTYNVDEDDDVSITFDEDDSTTFGDGAGEVRDWHLWELTPANAGEANWVKFMSRSTFNSVVNPVMVEGYNIAPGGTLIDDTEPAIFRQVETNYDDGADQNLEYHHEVRWTDAVDHRFYSWKINRDAASKNVEGQIDFDKFSFRSRANNEQTLVIQDDVYEIQNGAFLRFSGNDRTILEGESAGGAFHELLRYDAGDRIQIGKEAGGRTLMATNLGMNKNSIENTAWSEWDARSSDPGDPNAGRFRMWLSDGTGSGADGDVMLKVRDTGGTTKTITLVDFSAN